MRIAVYGLGKLGFPLADVMTQAGHNVLGVDPLVPVSSIEPGLGPQSFFTTKDPVPTDVSFIVVPTPSTASGRFDLVYIERALSQIAMVNQPGHIAVIVSTVSPGSCDLLASNFDSLALVYNPTFIALGDVVRGLTQPDVLLIGGANQDAVNVIDVLWQTVFVKEQARYAGKLKRPHVHVAGFTEVELIKLSVNAALGTKISLANSLGALFELWGVDPKAVEIVGRDPRIGTAYFTPGSPITGPCLPRDNVALRSAAHEKGVELPLAEATDFVNALVVDSIYQRVMAYDPTSVGILGMSYKYGSDVTEAAPGPWLADRLAGTTVRVVLTHDDVLGGDDLDNVLGCDVVVFCHREYETTNLLHPRVVRLWPA